MGRPAKKTQEGRPSARDNQVTNTEDYVSMFFIDPGLLNTKDWHYAWIETHCMNQETQSIERAMMKAYEPVEKTEFPQLAIYSEKLSKVRGRGNDDPYIRKGDQILMKCPRTLFEKRQNQLRKTNDAVIRNVDTNQLDFRGAPTFIHKENKITRTTEPTFAPDTAQ